MKKILLFIVLCSTAFIFIGCNKDVIVVEDTQIELITDNHFVNGFTISPADKDPQPDNRYPLDYDITYGNPTGQISWLSGQAGNIYGLADAYALDGKEVEYTDSNYIIEDQSKKLIINPETGRLTFELNASQEYSAPRESKEAWPHLLIMQGLSQQITLDEVDQIILSVDITLDKLINYMTAEEYDSSLHTAQFLMYIVARSNAAEDAGEFMWFGIPFYDARYTVLPESGMIDAGTAGNTGKFIYQMPQNEFMPNGLPLNQEVNISIDIIPYFQRALALAHEQEVLLGTSVEDLYLTNMNLGFEVPGTYDIAITIENFSLLAMLKDIE